jgi:DNA repair protein RecN (Recombination protein N)
MLVELTIKNLALIDSLHLSFDQGFNVLTGETGAGKSILVGSIGLLLGGKGSLDFIRFGKDVGEVSGVFDLSGNQEALLWLKDHEIEPEAGRYVTLRRILRREGRSSSFIESSSFPMGDLEEFTSYLVDMHGQHQHQSLFRIEVHRGLLDRFLGIAEDAKNYNHAFKALQEVNKKLQEAVEESENLKDQEILWKKQLAEITAADLQDGEEEELESKEKRLKSFDQEVSALEEIHQAFQGEKGIISQLRHSKTRLDELRGVDGEYEELFSRAETSYLDLEDLGQEIRARRLSLDFSPEELQRIQDRLSQIYSLEKKYGHTIALVLEKAEDIGQKLQRTENFDDFIADLEKQKTQLEQKVKDQAKSLSERRKAGKIQLEKRLVKLLSDLGMPGLRFSVDLSHKFGANGAPLFGPYGMDYVEFLFSPNTGQPLKPLKSIASGGELSRVMLGLKTLLSHADNIGVLIFDEIDSGIGGEVGNKLGQYLRALGQKKQVLSITHLASVASYGNRHFYVRKSIEGSDTVSRVDVLDKEDRVVEVARMLSGDKEGERSLDHSRELLEKNAF